MSFIEGTVTISLETLDSLREKEELFKRIRNSASGLIERIDSEQYEKKCKEIDVMNIPDDDLKRMLREARSTLKIVISAGCLRRLIREFIDSEKSAAHYEISEMSKEEFAKIPLILESGQRQDIIEYCSLVSAYGKPNQTDGKCDGFQKSGEDDEPCEICKKCTLNTFYEEEK